MHLGVATTGRAHSKAERHHESEAESSECAEGAIWERFAEALDRLFFYIAIVFAIALVVAFPAIGYRIQESIEV